MPIYLGSFLAFCYHTPYNPTSLLVCLTDGVTGVGSMFPAQVGGTAVLRLDFDLLDLVDLLEVLAAPFTFIGIGTQGPVALPFH